MVMLTFWVWMFFRLLPYTGHLFTRICGQAIGYQHNSADAFHSSSHSHTFLIVHAHWQYNSKSPAVILTTCTCIMIQTLCLICTGVVNTIYSSWNLHAFHIRMYHSAECLVLTSKAVVVIYAYKVIFIINTIARGNKCMGNGYCIYTQYST